MTRRGVYRISGWWGSNGAHSDGRSFVLTGFVGGKRGYRDLIRRLAKWHVAPRWYAAALLINPVVLLVLLSALNAFSPAFAPRILATTDPLGTIGVAVALGLAAGLFEEIGWTGFATPRLLQRWSVLSTGLVIGLLWSAWHIAADIPGAAPEWGTLEPLRVLTWMFAGMMPYRILMTWVYRHTESLFLAVFMHAAYTGVQRARQ